MPSEKRALLLRALQERLVPAILALGFDQLPLREEDRKSPEMRNGFPFGYFRRIRGTDYELLEVQLDKGSKPQFVLNLGVVGPAGADVPWRHFEQHEAPITASREAYRLHPRKDPGPLGSWFTEGDAAVALLPEAEQWFESRVVGPHMRRYGFASHSAGLAHNA
ncbi:MAG TPA: hypothetical protein VKV73_01855 [Chloroflexota bacterium]|nr:hypothetical protein [Chloroflexota bacterium]